MLGPFKKEDWIRNGAPCCTGICEHETAACTHQGLPDGRSTKLQGRLFGLCVSTKEAMGYLKTHEILGMFLHAPDGLDKIQGYPDPWNTERRV